MDARNMFTMLAFLLFLTTSAAEASLVSHSKSVGVNLGLNDAEAVVGKVFRYKISEDAFVGDVDRYEVTEAGSTTLQNWLIWNSATLELIGVAGEQDSGPNYVQVTAIGADSIDSNNNNNNDVVNYLRNNNPMRLVNNRAKDIFSINVNDEFRSTSNRIQFEERISCDDGPATTATIVLGVDYDSLSSRERIDLLNKISDQFSTAVDGFRLFSNNDDSFSSLKRNILLASSSNAANATTSTVDQQGNEAVITWRINCDGVVPTRENSPQFDALLNLDDNGWKTEGESTLGYPVNGWYVALTSYEAKRRRRQASYVTPNSNVGATGGQTSAYDVTVANVPTRSPSSTRTPTIRIRPTGFVTTSDFERTSTSRRTTTTTTEKTSTITTTPTPTIRTRPTLRTTQSTTSGTTAILVTRKPGDSRPTLTNSLGTLRCRQNSVCYIPIPAQTFHDAEDGDTTKLSLRVDVLGDTPKKDNWLHLDEQRQQLLGLPLHSGTFSFRLTATDSGNRHASHAFSIEVLDDPLTDEQLNHRIIMDFNVLDEKNFTGDVKNRIWLLQKLAQYFGDTTAEKIRVNSLSQNGFVLSWSNNTLPIDRCGRNELKSIQGRLIKEDGQVRAQFKRFMESAFMVQKVRIERTGVCAESPPETPKPKTAIEAPIVVPTVASTERVNATTTPAPTTNFTTSSTSSASRDNFFISTILPAIIITLFLIVATLVACILYRRNRQHKKGRAESKSEFVSKGAPVIFPDEVDLDKESTAATPMLLKDEKPPLQPLDFSGVGGGHMESRHGNGNGHNGGAPLVRSPLILKPPSSIGPGRALGKTHVSEAETELWQRPLLQDMDENPLYRPPPAFEPAGVKENRSPRPKHASPQQRDPPPYVPP